MVHVRNNKCVVFILIFACIIAQTQSQACITPNGENATCVSLYNCPALISAIATQNESAIEFVSQSECTTHPLVCCGSYSGFNSTLTTNNETSQKPNVTIPGENVLPDPSVCGLQHTDARSYNDSNAALDEFPWIALLKYNDINGQDGGFKCAGTLISKRYVLTAGHCLRTRKWYPIGVQLGEYNINKHVDCETNPDYPKCNDAVDVEIEEVIIHENYTDSNYSTNDIGLLRLNKTVYFTDYIRPICLPLPGTRLAEIGEFMFSSGFAKPEWVERGFLERKKRSQIELISNEECLQYYYGSLGKRIITSGHMCGKEYDDFLCKGDSGGPLMIASRLRWHQEGIVSFSLGCGPGIITIYTRVSEYLDWLRITMRP